MHDRPYYVIYDDSLVLDVVRTEEDAQDRVLMHLSDFRDPETFITEARDYSDAIRRWENYRRAGRPEPTTTPG